MPLNEGSVIPVVVVEGMVVVEGTVTSSGESSINTSYTVKSAPYSVIALVAVVVLVPCSGVVGVISISKPVVVVSKPGQSVGGYAVVKPETTCVENVHEPVISDHEAVVCSYSK